MDEDLKQRYRRAAERVRSVLRAHEIDVTENMTGELCTHLVRKWKGVTPRRKTAENKRMLSRLKKIDVFLSRQVDALPDLQWSTLKWIAPPQHAEIVEEHDIRIEIQRLRDKLRQAADLFDEGSGKPGNKRTARGLAAIEMYRVLRQAGVTDLWKCCQIIVGILDDDPPDKDRQKAIIVMYDRLKRISH